MAPPRIICKAGPSLQDLEPVSVNGAALPINSSDFEGAVAVRIQGYHGPSGEQSKSTPDSDFSHEGDSWSIELEGRFKEEVEVEHVMFGNVWEKPIRDHLPYGTAAVLRFGQLLDPALHHDLYADQPFALSPLLATMNYASITSTSPTEPFRPTIPGPVEDDLTPLLPSHAELKGAADKRKAFLGRAENRKGLKLGPDMVVKADFANGFIDFEALALKLPIGLSFPLAKYWDGQPVSFVCRSRDASKTYLVVSFTLEQEPAVGDATSKKADVEAASEEKEDVAEEPAEDRDELGVD